MKKMIWGAKPRKGEGARKFAARVEALILAARVANAGTKIQPTQMTEDQFKQLCLEEIGREMVEGVEGRALTEEEWQRRLMKSAAERAPMN